MDKKVELTNIFRAELVLLSKKILNNINQSDLDEIYQFSRELHEKIMGIKLLTEHLNHEELLDMQKGISSDVVASNRQKETVDSENISRDFSEKQAEIKDSKTPSTVGQIYKNISNMEFVAKEKREMDQDIEKKVQSEQKSVVEKKMKIGINDRIAFVKHLFDGDSDKYTEVVGRLNAFESYELALNYISYEVKPKYNYWKDKDEYEFRLIQLLELKFS